MSAIATVALLVGLELADGSAPTDPNDEVHDQRTIELFGAAMGLAVIGSGVSLARSRPVPGRGATWWSGVGLVWAGAALNRTARRHLGSAYRARVTVVFNHESRHGGWTDEPFTAASRDHVTVYRLE